MELNSPSSYIFCLHLQVDNSEKTKTSLCTHQPQSHTDKARNIIEFSTWQILLQNFQWARIVFQAVPVNVSIAKSFYFSVLR